MDYNHVYFVGIGGIGMSALARYFRMKNIKVSGYDKTETALTRKLVGEGIEIIYEDSIEDLPQGIDLVVYTPAVPSELHILKTLQSRGIPIVKRAKLLGLLSEHARTIAVSGTHGKTTTTSLVAHCLKDGGIDISAFLGGILTGYETNYFLGKSDWMVVEADEFDRSFHHLQPEIAIINAMDADHLDIYGSQEQFSEAFYEFVMKMHENGLLLMKEGVENYFSADQMTAIRQHVEVVTFGFGTNCNVKIEVQKYSERGMPIFDLHCDNGEKLYGLECSLPGDHNVSNATAAILACQKVGLGEAEIRRALVNFKGVKRRFERIAEKNGLVYIDDYAHHPEEILAVCKGVRDAYPSKKVVAIFQPHLFTRTRDFMQEFADALDGFDEVILLEIYAAREQAIEGITSEALAKCMKKPVAVLSKENVMDVLKEKKYDVVITIGAGDIDTLVPQIKNIIEALK